jgi:hypothetical protein
LAFPTFKHPKENHDQGNHKQEVYQRTGYFERQTYGPQDEQNDC